MISSLCLGWESNESSEWTAAEPGIQDYLTPKFIIPQPPGSCSQGLKLCHTDCLVPQEEAHHRKEFYRGAGSIFPHQMGQVSIRLKPNTKGKCCKSKEEKSSVCLTLVLVLSLPGWGTAVATEFWAGVVQAEHPILPQLLPAPSTSHRQRAREGLLGSLLYHRSGIIVKASF